MPKICENFIKIFFLKSGQVEVLDQGSQDQH
jgi:hypothetical protein